jgi:hypothetical protein
MRKKNPKIKTCPFLDQACLKSECGIYNENFEHCEIGLMIYNLYQLTTVMKQQLEMENK